MKRKICVITGSRADYGLLKPLIEEIKADKDLRLQLVATGSHLSLEFGLTYKEIEEDGFIIIKKVKILSGSDSPAAIATSMGTALTKFASVYKNLKPDITVVLGDRYEIFSAVATAVVLQIPVAHISGGEVTEGAVDDYFRHCITKMSYLHFTAAKEYRKRVIQLGEHPRRVFDTGSLAIDNIKNLKPLSRQVLEKELKFKFNKHNFLVTFHPVTLEDNTSEEQFGNLLEALDGLKNTRIIFTKANADTYGRVINRMIDKYVLENSNKAVVFTSMGQLKYFSVMQFMDAVIGNSSSGIVEAPSFKIGTINIGDRQEGRIKAKSIIDCDPTNESIKKAIREIYSSKFQGMLTSLVNPYSGRNTARQIVKILKKYNLKNILKKNFYDISFKGR